MDKRKNNNFLNQITTAKREEIERAKKAVPENILQERAEARQTLPRGFKKSLRCQGIRIIAEIKRASPSKGDIHPELDPAHMATAYEAGGAAAISVLTESRFFKGSTEDLLAAREVTSVPILRKDFTISKYQVYETAAMGADALLAIVRILDNKKLKSILTLSAKYRLDVLTEVYDETDLTRALDAGATLIGINNRNLESFDTDIDRAAKIAAGIPSGIIAVSLSGIVSAEDIARQLQSGLSRFLVGEALSRSIDPASMLKSMIAIGGTV
jgi:indole-3-glycerol phosphate synthase